MIKVKTLHSLKFLDSGPVFVKSKKRIYHNFNGEWIPRQYFSTNDVAEIVGIPDWYVRKLMDKLRLRDNLDYLSVLTIIKAVKIKKDNKKMKFVELKQKMKV